MWKSWEICSGRLRSLPCSQLCVLSEGEGVVMAQVWPRVTKGRVWQLREQVQSHVAEAGSHGTGGREGASAFPALTGGAQPKSPRTHKLGQCEWPESGRQPPNWERKVGSACPQQVTCALLESRCSKTGRSCGWARASSAAGPRGDCQGTVLPTYGPERPAPGHPAIRPPRPRRRWLPLGGGAGHHCCGSSAQGSRGKA